ncbi:hypothetical protein LO762_24015 [Actinocorallia sp. API 0066]|uniref:DUF6879 family protein n=1 Tax=Actinocorallia sp. API 0066 TaxID=2896846 RepID=UPI001E58EC85|nr:DUF6879 family protein [Actinocorallia sp. API 0066]MCD0452234.1 hypothetical protein [Actinocorallia sp. API 0066]
MESISAEERGELFATFRKTADHLELRDFYASSDLEKSRFAAWLAGEPDDLGWMGEWCERMRRARAAGRSYRRAIVVSEPVSDYRRFAHHVLGPAVEAGEEVGYAPRRLLSGVALPGNDFWLFDEAVAVFTVFSGDGAVVDRQKSTDPVVIELCRAAFASVRSVAIPHGDYRPS